MSLKRGAVQKANHAHTQRLHERRQQDVPPYLIADAELDRQLRALQMEWLRSSPAYRELIRQRVSVAAKARERAWRLIERRLPDVDNLGRDPEGCG